MGLIRLVVYLNRYLYIVTYQLIYNVVAEQAASIYVRTEELEFIANFYKYGIVGIVAEWIASDMKDDPKIIVERLNRLIWGSIQNSLNRVKQ